MYQFEKRDERYQMASAEAGRIADELPTLAEKIEELRARISGLSSAADDLDDKGLTERVNLLSMTLNDVLNEGQ